MDVLDHVVEIDPFSAADDSNNSQTLPQLRHPLPYPLRAVGKALPCVTNADMLHKIAKILDDMSHTPNKLVNGNDEAEIVVAVTLQANLCDLEDEVNLRDLRSAASEAIANAVVTTNKKDSLTPLPTAGGPRYRSSPLARRDGRFPKGREQRQRVSASHSFA